jgi:hypothetical protein
MKENLLKLLATRSSVEVQGIHTVYWMPSRVFNELDIIRWKHNRPADESRVLEIRNWMRESKRLDGVIYLAWINDRLVCYESNHRREALRGLDGIHNVLVDIIWDATDDMIKEEFSRINKAVSVPLQYTEPDPTINTEDFNHGFDRLCETYKSVESKNKNYRRPHFYQPELRDDVYRIVQDLRISLDEVARRLDRRNTKLSKQDRSKLPKTVVEKCEKTGIWLFAWGSRISIGDVTE